MFGKTNTPEWGNHCTTEPSLFGPTVNPWSPSITPGGSSGGTTQAFFDVEFATTGWTSLANVTGWSAISLPPGATSDGLPIGVQVMAPDETILLQLAAQLETAKPWLHRRPSM